MIRIVTIIPFYNEFKALQRLLMHLSEMNLPAIFCDGRFHNFRKIKNSDFSTDGSRFLIHGFKNTTMIEYGPCNVEDKINKLLHESAKQKYSYAILLGCDEFLEGNLDLLKENLISFSLTDPTLMKVRFIEHKQKMDKPQETINRIFYMPGLVCARNTHNSFFSASDQAKGILREMRPYPICAEGIKIHHDNLIRTKERNELMRDYQGKIKETKF